jgi:hypothetical protein
MKSPEVALLLTITHRHMVGHTHDQVDGEHAHIRAFFIGTGCGKRTQGAVVATPNQMKKAMTMKGKKSIWNKNDDRCDIVLEVGCLLLWTVFLAGLAATPDGLFGGFKGKYSLFKLMEVGQ